MYIGVCCAEETKWTYTWSCMRKALFHVLTICHYQTPIKIVIISKAMACLFGATIVMENDASKGAF